MRITSRRGLGRAVAGVAAAVLMASGLTLAAAPASAQEGFSFGDRLSGDDRFETAADIALETFGTADTVLLATGVNFPDALTGNFLAGAIGDTPLLLTLPDALPAATRDALVNLEAEIVIVLGGNAAVSQAVENELDDDYVVERIAGLDRYKTAEQVANEGADSRTVGMHDDLRTAILGNGENFPDVLAAGPLGYAEGFPITITFATTLPVETRRVLVDLDIEQVIIVGGTDVVSAAVQAEVETITGNPAERLSGEDRFATARVIGNFAYDDLGFDVSHVNLARGDDARPSPSQPRQGFADALTGGPHAGDERAPIVLTNPNNLPDATESLLEQRCPTLADGHIFGGFAAVSTPVANTAEEAASDCDSANRVTVAPADTSIEAGAPATGTVTIGMGFDTDDVESITVSGCGVTNQPVTDTDPSAPGIQYSVQIPESQAPGQCTLTFTTRFEDGFVETDEVSITVTSGEIEVRPDTPATATVAVNPDSTTVDDRSFAVDGLAPGQEYRITVVKAENVSFNSTGEPVFAEDGSSGLAATGNPTADITRVDDAPARNNTGPGTSFTTNSPGASPSAVFVAGPDGTATFTIDGDTPESVRPVVYVNGGASPRLELNEDGTAAEPADVGGVTNFTAPPSSPPPAADTTPASTEVAVAIEENTGSDSLRVTYDEPVQGVGTYLLRDAANGVLVSEFEVTDITADGRSVILRVPAGGAPVDFDDTDQQMFTLEILNERDEAGNQTNTEVPVDETGTINDPTAPAPPPEEDCPPLDLDPICLPL